MQKAAPPPAAGLLHEEEADDGWVLLRSGGGTTSVTAPPAGSRPPRPPPLPGARSPATGGLFEPTPDDLVGRYLPARRALRCGDLPPQIHDADVYGAHHPAFLAKLHPPANANRPDAWFFFVCRRRGLGGKRTAGPGAYRLAGESTSNPRAAWYCHSFRYHEDSPEASASRETEWCMDEYGDRDAGERDDGEAFDMVVCKVYPARGGALHERLLRRVVHGTDARPPPQVLVQLYLASISVGDPLRCRMHRATDTDIYAAHPAVLTAVLPAANDRFEWLFVVRRARQRTEHGDGGEDGTVRRPRPRRAGSGQYVPAARYWGVKDGEGRELGYRRLFRYREDDEEVRRASRTVWCMEEYGFGPGFPYGEHGDGEELLVYKVYQRMAQAVACGTLEALIRAGSARRAYRTPGAPVFVIPYSIAVSRTGTALRIQSIGLPSILVFIASVLTVLHG